MRAGADATFNDKTEVIGIYGYEDRTILVKTGRMPAGSGVYRVTAGEKDFASGQSRYVLGREKDEAAE